MAHIKIFVLFFVVVSIHQSLGGPMPSRFGRSDPLIQKTSPEEVGQEYVSNEYEDLLVDLFDRIQQLKQKRLEQIYKPGSFAKFRG